jgi:hypothetical protein
MAFLLIAVVFVVGFCSVFVGSASGVAAGFVLTLVGASVVGLNAESFLRREAGPGTSFGLVLVLLVFWGLGWLSGLGVKSYVDKQ